MKTKINYLLTALFMCSILIMPTKTAGMQIVTQISQSHCQPFNPYLKYDRGNVQDMSSECIDNRHKVVFNNNVQKINQNVLPLSIGGPDDFGYTYDDTVSYNWISATENSGIIENDGYIRLDIGFNFPFYGILQNQLYVSTNGLITFGSGSGSYINSDIPTKSTPNNLIAVFWEDLIVGNSYSDSAIYYSQGGSEPNRYFVVEWRNITDYYDELVFSFEAILYENGDIVLQYQSLPDFYYATIGIENNSGDDGLQYQYSISGLKEESAVRFYYPNIFKAGVSIYPLELGNLATIGGNTYFTITIANTGNMGADTYELTTTSLWPISLYTADGKTSLVDTDNDGKIDTGKVGQGEMINILIKVQTPVTASIGDSNSAVIEAHSSKDSNKHKTTTLKTTVPPPFVQVYDDEANGAMSLDLIRPTSQVIKKISTEKYYGTATAITITPNGDFVYAWSISRNNGSVSIREIEYAFLDRYGNIQRPISKLIDNSAATIDTADLSPSVAVAPDGTLGIVWVRRLYNKNVNKFNYNTWFALLDKSGNMIGGPFNLTNNSIWGTFIDSNFPRFYFPTIIATDDNRFIISWEKYISRPSNSFNIWMAIRDTTGARIINSEPLTDDDKSWGPILNNLKDGKAILTWISNDPYYQPTYAIIRSDGFILKTEVIPNSTYNLDYPDAVLLPNGKIAIAWATETGVQFAILDPSYNIETISKEINNPFNSYGEGISIATDTSSHLIMTWENSDNYQDLFYALGNSSGSFITEPMFYKQSNTWMDTSYNGQGNAFFDFRYVYLPLIVR